VEDEVAGGLRKLHSEAFPNLYSSSNIIKEIKPFRISIMSGKSTTHGNAACNISDGKSEGTRPFRRPGSGW
jgi:hypothetical protein